MTDTNTHCVVCRGDWNYEAEVCNTCGTTGMAIWFGFSGMRRLSKRFRYINPNKLKKRRKHGRVGGSHTRLVMKRSRLKGSQAALLARRQADTIRAAQGKGKTGDAHTAAQIDSGRE